MILIASYVTYVNNVWFFYFFFELIITIELIFFAYGQVETDVPHTTSDTGRISSSGNQHENVTSVVGDPHDKTSTAGDFAKGFTSRPERTCESPEIYSPSQSPTLFQDFS